MTKKKPPKQKSSKKRASVVSSRTTRKTPIKEGISTKAVYYLIKIAMLFSDNVDDFWDESQS